MAETMWKDVPLNPSLSHLQVKNIGQPPKEQDKITQTISKAHVESFNFMLREGLVNAVKNIPSLEFELSDERIKLEIQGARISNPVVHKDSLRTSVIEAYPAECRSRGVTYKGRLHITFSWSKNGIVQDVSEKQIGEVPIMVKSDACNLNKLSPKELIQRGEETEEFGGYFVVNGNEKIVRMLIMQRRNYPIAMKRPSWKKRGPMFSEYGVSLRCVKSDQTGTNNVLHYLTNGTAVLMFSYKKELFFAPVIMILKAFYNVTDYHIYTEMIRGKEKNTFLLGCVENMLRQIQNEGLLSHLQIKRYIGKTFRHKVGLPHWISDEEVTDFLFKQCICTHLESNMDKFNLLVFMTRKLFALSKNECAVESPDNPMNQEVLLSGHLFLMVLKEKLEVWLHSVRVAGDRKVKAKSGKVDITHAFMNHCVAQSADITRGLEYMLATGNLISNTGLGLQQFSGLSVIADKLNYWRYLAHFRCVHRGAFFAEMRTTTVRKLLPEVWGFMCPVHTPDGSPCGLMNHMTAMCEMVNVLPNTSHLPRLFSSLGMFPFSGLLPCSVAECYTVLLDGKLIGWTPKELAPKFVANIRHLKTMQKERVPLSLEIALVPITGKASLYPGIFVFTTPARMSRPVINLAENTVEMIGTFEQVYLNISVIPEEAIEGVTTHQEIRETSMLSILGNMIPYSDFNQSPRNMYECQMGKQTMGTPCSTYRYRSDNKMYRIQTPQSPLVRPAMYDYYQMDNYPLGTNAIVAVISYTGYDMEDAMILNKASLERGFKHGSIYKSEFINLRKLAGDRGKQVSLIFGRKIGDTHLEHKLDFDGLPYIGIKLEYGDPICSYIDQASGETRIHKYKYTEEAYVDQVKLLGNDTGTDILQNICITFWIPRNPIIGDKFASRHGQKGVCSQKWPIEDMPFTENGMTPDIIFNPHGFPSRMTIGMMIESMAGKLAAAQGTAIDATPFKFSENNSAAEYFGELLQKAGYNYYGTERMYSGIDGRELEADIFFGIVYYQRLRHMVADKFQVRTTGPIDILTHQPIKGRKRCGGIRFGEMERDSLLAHGTSFLLQDRLFNCSDKSVAHVCIQCGSLLSPVFENPPVNQDLPTSKERLRCWTCAICDTSEYIELIYVPYVFRYLVSELAAINIKVKLGIK